VLLVVGAPCQLKTLAGQEHGRTIPLTDIRSALAQGLPDTKVGTFTPALYAEAKKKNWTVISIKN
jgi:hypothetical protein